MTGSAAAPTVLYEDNHCLAINKPAGMLSMGDITGDYTAVDWARDYLREKYSKPGNIFVGVVHRLDRPVSGVLLLARTSKAASRLSDLFRRHDLKKTYQAVAEGRLEQPQGTWVDWLSKDDDSNTVRTTLAGEPGSRECRLRFAVIQELLPESDLETGRGTSARNVLSHVKLEPETGRGHQLRVQLASRQHPIAGDGKYGSGIRLSGWIALHASQLEFKHPTRDEQVLVTAPLPADWAECFGIAEQ